MTKETHLFNLNTNSISGLTTEGQELPEHLIDTGASTKAELYNWKLAKAVETLNTAGFTADQSVALAKTVSLFSK